MKRNLLVAVLLFLGVFAYAQTSGGGDISVYPNPATEFIQIADRTGEAQTVVLYNLVGRKLRSFDYSAEQQYIVSDLPKGMYIVQIVNRSGNAVATQKINKR